MEGLFYDRHRSLRLYTYNPEEGFDYSPCLLTAMEKVEITLSNVPDVRYSKESYLSLMSCITKHIIGGCSNTSFVKKDKNKKFFIKVHLILDLICQDKFVRFKSISGQKTLNSYVRYGVNGEPLKFPKIYGPLNVLNENKTPKSP